MIHLAQNGDFALQLGRFPENPRNNETALGIRLHFGAVIGRDFKELALGWIGGRQRGEAGLDGFPDGHGVKATCDAIHGGQVVTGASPALASGEGLQVGFEGRGQLESPFFVHRGR